MIRIGHAPEAILAPPWACRFRSDDLSEIRSYIGDKDGPHARVAKGDQPLGYTMFRVSASHAHLGASESAVLQIVRGHVHGAVLLLALPPASTIRIGRRLSAPSVAGTVALIPPGWAFTRRSPPGTLFAAEIDARTLLSELAYRRPDLAHRGLGQIFMPEVALDERQALLQSATDLMWATEPGMDITLQAHAESRFVERMVDLMLRADPTQRPGDLALDRARDLEGWIEAHLGDPISMGTLCRIAGVGERCLQKSFLHRRGISPMRYVTERRLLAAHQWLKEAPQTVTVTEAALCFGFSHLGRFSASYREVLGESPSRTLATARLACPL